MNERNKRLLEKVRSNAAARKAVQMFADKYTPQKHERVVFSDNDLWKAFRGKIKFLWSNVPGNLNHSISKASMFSNDAVDEFQHAYDELLAKYNNLVDAYYELSGDDE